MASGTLPNVYNEVSGSRVTWKFDIHAQGSYEIISHLDDGVEIRGRNGTNGDPDYHMQVNAGPNNNINTEETRVYKENEVAWLPWLMSKITGKTRLVVTLLNHGNQVLHFDPTEPHIIAV